MSEATLLLNAIETGDAKAADQLLPLVYEELRRLAAGKMASSLAAGAFYAYDREVFAYLANFVVDLSLVGVALGCWALLGRTEVEARAPV